MSVNRVDALKLAGIAVGIMSVAALMVVVAPVVRGQTKENYWLTGGLPGQSAQIGVVLRDIDDADMKRERLAGPQGAIISDVRSDSPAARAGFKTGDIVLNFDGEVVRGARHLSRLISETPEGREVQVTILRSGDRMILKVAAAGSVSSGSLYYDYDAVRPKVLRTPDIRVPDVNTSRLYAETLRHTLPRLYTESTDGRWTLVFSGAAPLGAEVQELGGQLGEYFGATTGVLVTSVEEGKPAKAAGLRAGDVITKVNNESVRTPDDLRRMLRSISGEIAITVIRDKKEQTLKAKIEREEPVETTLFKSKRRGV